MKLGLGMLDITAVYSHTCLRENYRDRIGISGRRDLESSRQSKKKSLTLDLPGVSCIPVFTDTSEI